MSSLCEKASNDLVKSKDYRKNAGKEINCFFLCHFKQ